MGLLHRLGIIEETAQEEAPQTEEKQEEKNVEATSAPVSTPHSEASMKFAMPQANKSSTPGQIVGKIDDEVYEKLSEAIERNNLDGNDFLEFMQSLTGMQHLVVDEGTKFNMVFTTLASTQGGFTKEICLNSIQHYLDVINNEKNIFLGEMQGATQTMVTESIGEKERLEELANQKAEQILQLQNEIQEISNNASELGTSAEEATVKIAQKEADFEVTVAQLVGQLGSYEEKIKKYIK